MLSKNDVVEILRREKPYIAQVYGVTRIGLFGSFARDNATENSDVDLLLEFSNLYLTGYQKSSRTE